MAFYPKFKDLILYRSLAIDFFNSLTTIRLVGMKGRTASADEMAQIAQLRAAVVVLNRLGAIKPEWIEKENILSDEMMQDPDIKRKQDD